MRQRIFISKVRDILSDNAGIRLRTRQRSGSGLDAATLALVPAGQMRVFTKKERRQYHDYHIILLLDASGSMKGGGRGESDGDKLENACRATHALWYALIQSGAKVDVLSFNQTLEPIKPEVVADFPTLLQISNRHLHSYGAGNHDGFHVEKAVKILQKEGRPGQIVLVLSDGMPSCDYAPCKEDGCSRNLSIQLTRTVKKVRRQTNTLLLAVGILTDAPVDYYGERHTAVVDNISDLYPKMARLLERHIVRG